MPPADHVADEEETLEVRGPGGWAAKAKGERTPLWMLVIVCIAGLSVAGWSHHEKTHESLQRLTERFDELSYLISLSPTEREKLNLAMPDSLRQKLRRRRDE